MGACRNVDVRGYNPFVKFNVQLEVIDDLVAVSPFQQFVGGPKSSEAPAIAVRVIAAVEPQIVEMDGRRVVVVSKSHWRIESVHLAHVARHRFVKRPFAVDSL